MPTATHAVGAWQLWRAGFSHRNLLGLCASGGKVGHAMAVLPPCAAAAI